VAANTPTVPVPRRLAPTETLRFYLAQRRPLRYDFLIACLERFLMVAPRGRVVLRSAYVKRVLSCKSRDVRGVHWYLLSARWA